MGHLSHTLAGRADTNTNIEFGVLRELGREGEEKVLLIIELDRGQRGVRALPVSCRRKVWGTLHKISCTICVNSYIFIYICIYT